MGISRGQTVLVFGVFDMLHPGHMYFLNKAQKLGDELHICLASDVFVNKNKNKNPTFDYPQRCEMLKKAFPNCVIHLGDEQMGAWSIFQDFMPHIIALGHDQNDLARELEKLALVGTSIITIEPFKKEIYSTSKLSQA